MFRRSTLTKRVGALERKADTMAQTVTEVKAAIKQQIADINTSLTNIVGDVQGLKDKLAAGGNATVHDFDEILTSLQTLGTAMQAADDSVPPLDPVP